MLRVKPEDSPYPLGFFMVDNQLVRYRIGIEAQDGPSARPLAFLASGGNLVSCSFRYDFTLKLREGEKDV